MCVYIYILIQTTISIYDHICKYPTFSHCIRTCRRQIHLQDRTEEANNVLLSLERGDNGTGRKVGLLLGAEK